MTEPMDSSMDCVCPKLGPGMQKIRGYG